MKQEFADHGALVAAAASISAARAAIDAAGMPEALIVDYDLNDGATGLQFVEALRARGVAPPVVMISGSTDAGRRRRAARLGPAVADQAGRSARAALDADRRAGALARDALGKSPRPGRPRPRSSRRTTAASALVSNYSNQEQFQTIQMNTFFVADVAAPP